MMAALSSFKPVACMVLLSMAFSTPVLGADCTVEKKLLRRLDNGLAVTPPMGWNSYNHYSCSPNEDIIHSNAQALVDLGLKDLGYHYVTVDCGWTLPNRTAEGTLTWNPALFPSGYPALGDFIHGLGLGFGVYSDGGVQMCMAGEPAQAGSLFHEKVDAETFASWGADLLKYDNCYSDAATGYPNVEYTPSVSPSSHYVTMSNAVLATGRKILFQICDWGVDFPSAWAPFLGNSWRISNDIIPSYRTISRILNQVVPQTSFAGPGQWLDLDMLEVGNNVFTIPEEQTHFSLWAIIKSPLVIGGALKDASTSISEASLAILKNKDVIGYNQDRLGVAASFRRRWTSDYEIWAGPLSGNRMVVAIINLQDVARTLTVDFPDVGVQKAGSVKDIWNDITLKNVLTSYSAPVAAHGTILLELGATTVAGFYSAADAIRADQTTTFTNLYGRTTSANYSLTINFLHGVPNPTLLAINNTIYTLPANSASLTLPHPLPFTISASNTNTLTITSPNDLQIASLTLVPPPEAFYPSTTFSPQGQATRDICSAGACAPVGSKIGSLSPAGSASAVIPSPPSPTTTAPPAAAAGAKHVTLYFTNNDVSLSTSWTTGTNTRNLTLLVNGVVTRVEVPLSGRSSELFSPGKGWEDTGTFEVLVDGWLDGDGVDNVVVVGNQGGEDGVVQWAADFVGLGILW